jgi:diadenylate cyclase
MEIFRIYNIQFTLTNLVDFVLIGFIIYQLYRILKGSLAFNMMAGLLTIYVAWLIVHFFKMPLMEAMLGEFTKVGILAILIVFQQEIRRFLLLLGRGTLNHEHRNIFRFLPWNWKVEKGFNTNYEEIVDVCETLARNNTGALLIFPRTSEMKFIGASGEVLDAMISKKLILSIFDKNSPLHDGAVIIANNRIKAANAVLPVSDNPEHQAKYGLRHLSAIGITEQTDAIAVIISEEKGTMAIAREGKITENMDRDQVLDILLKAFGNDMVKIKSDQ